MTQKQGRKFTTPSRWARSFNDTDTDTDTDTDGDTDADLLIIQPLRA
jgi:hypothetical protein